jgi:hypothetical protein
MHARDKYPLTGLYKTNQYRLCEYPAIRTASAGCHHEAATHCVTLNDGRVFVVCAAHCDALPDEPTVEPMPAVAPSTLPPTIDELLSAVENLQQVLARVENARAFADGLVIHDSTRARLHCSLAQLDGLRGDLVEQWIGAEITTDTCSDCSHVA